ncbi:MAG: hypothetical protein JXQ75_18385 [Phycisphaerae bacterium]|nr:hypothetical protein [Phycisphaerae bacterium]
MNKTAMFLRDANDGSPDLDTLIDVCRREAFEVVVHAVAPDRDLPKSLLPSTPAVVFLPALEEDCLGVKLAQIARGNGNPRLVVLYAPSLPSSEYLCLAFREGVDDVISLDTCADALGFHVKRAERLLRSRWNASDSGGGLRQKIESLEHTCKDLARRNAKWEERLLSLASTAGRLAGGELRLGKNPPLLMIAASSHSQSASAAELATRLGFDPHIVHTGKEALQRVANQPPRIILTDGTLPDMDATTLARSARQVLGNKPVIIIAWSSSAESEEDLLAPGGGIDDFVLKSATSKGGGFLAAALLGGLR